MRKSITCLACLMVLAAALKLVPCTCADVSGFGDVTLNSGPLTSGALPSITDDTLTLTTIGTATQPSEYQATSAFFNVKQSMTNFAVHFTYQYTGTATQISADGFAFVLQNDPRGPQALGDRGGALGVGEFPAGTGQGTLPGTQITPSVALDFTLAPASVDPSGPGMAWNINGQTPQLGGQPSQSVAPVDLLRGDPINIDLTYQGTMLTETLTDSLIPADTFTTDDVADIPALLGSNWAYVGFTAGTGGGNAGQQISNFQFHTLSAVPEPSPLTLFALCGSLFVSAGWRGGRTARRYRRG